MRIARQEVLWVILEVANTFIFGNSLRSYSPIRINTKTVYVGRIDRKLAHKLHQDSSRLSDSADNSWRCYLLPSIFKIEDSVRVAKLWGRRKNRPAMNYDKLSRSIRQYYRKGIMKKTERSQRLVYQFCPAYAN
ncbi:SAM pointed domain-containing Ets transcription factor-like [Tropilaelaps mercedesae]|uniref:SAM pointed domain-containing Ets transcription factor-like n=1 Tax=Tropilaelaps mercedesae TaxID=418985 RepID=A0A1V9XPV2_9ACAR|nr:SAM pointed domain-containing Ets transcription factor-like [Tropilaelaps mercedesae]